MISMVFLSEFVSYIIKYVAFIAVAVAGVLCGKKLRDRKNAKQEEQTNG
ncbi:MAG: vanadium nitrogenase [Lachnospiraceae bacterium]